MNSTCYIFHCDTSIHHTQENQCTNVLFYFCFIFLWIHNLYISRHNILLSLLIQGNLCSIALLNRDLYWNIQYIDLLVLLLCSFNFPLIFLFWCLGRFFFQWFYLSIYKSVRLDNTKSLIELHFNVILQRFIFVYKHIILIVYIVY